MTDERIIPLEEYASKENILYSAATPDLIFQSMKLLSTAEVAKRLKVTQRRVVAMIASGKIKAHRVARDYVIEESALEGVKPWGKVGRPPWKGRAAR